MNFPVQNPFLRGMLQGPLKGAVEKSMLAQMEVWKAADPVRFNSLVKELTSMDRATYIKKLKSAAKKQGVDLENLAANLGITL